MLAAIPALLASSGCRLDMHIQPRYNPYDETEFFQDGQSARVPVAGTVPRGDLRQGSAELLYTGKMHGADSQVFPFAVTREVLERGRERFNIYCTPCHGLSGDADGMIVARGFPKPPSFHSERMRNAAPGHFFDVITHGFGAMYPYDYRVAPRDRWAIVAYIRALQTGRGASISDVPEPERQRLQSEPQ